MRRMLKMNRTLGWKMLEIPRAMPRKMFNTPSLDVSSVQRLQKFKKASEVGCNVL